jgi:hypothetical protein
VQRSLQAANAALSAVPAKSSFRSDATSAESSPKAIIPGARPDTAKAHERSSRVGDFIDIGEFGMVRSFVDHLVAKQALEEPDNRSSRRQPPNWETLVAAVADSRTLEQAIGRAVVIADRLARGLVDEFDWDEVGTPRAIDDSFFAFTMADVVPDFGDSRYRARVSRRVAGIIGIRSTPLTQTP